MRSTELQILLDLSSAIATVRNKDDLFRVILEKINPVFDCMREAVILTIDPDEEYYSLMMIESRLSESEIEFHKSNRFKVDGVMRNVLNREEAWLFETAPFVEQYADQPAAQVIKKLGVEEVMTCRLRVSGKNIGTFSLHSETIHHFRKEQLPLFKSVADMVAVAVSNILAGGELRIREKQKSHLLKISAHIATIREKDELFQLITEEIKSFIPFDDLVIAGVDEEKQTFGVFLSNMGQTSKAHQSYVPAITQVYPLVKGTVPYRVYESEAPFIIDVESEYLKDKSDYFRFAYEFGMKQELVGRLVHSGRVVGIVAMLSKKQIYSQTDIHTFQSLSSLLAIAVNNIIANEQLKLRQHQKSQLLKISSHIASIREKEDLFRLIAEEMKSFIDFDDVVIALFDEKKQHYSVFLSDVTGTTGKHKDYSQATNRQYPIIDGGIAQKVFNSEKPVLIDIENEHFRNPEIDSMKFAYQFGMREEIVVRLMYSGNVIGMMGVLSKKRHRYTRTDLDTISSLSSLVAIALNNILANQELKLRDEQKSQLLNISTHISTIRDKNDLFHLLTKEVRAFIDFDDAIISCVDEKQESFRVFVSDISNETRQHKDFSEATTRTFPIVRGGIADQVIQSDKPMIIDIKKELFKHPELEFLRLSYGFGFREELMTRLVHSGKVIGVFVLFSRVQDRFSESDAKTLQSLSSLVAVALKNSLANQEIEKLSRQLQQDNYYLNEEIKSNYNFEEIIGKSHAIHQVFKKVVQVAHVDSTVLILGETGTGKELIARAIHNLSSRKGRPLIKVNCAALPAQLIESELFGHEKGSFTGATDKRIGKFELASGSTIFLDEIGELPLELQAKLLRVLQEKEIERIGGEKSIKVNVRIIAATNRDLEEEVAAKKFRSDLFYRLHIYPVELPPLRERKDDIPLLASFFLDKLSNKLGKKITSISPQAMEELISYEWPGNIRELEHTIERSMLLTTGKTITTINISRPLIVEPGVMNQAFTPKKLSENEKELILRTLKFTKGKIRGTNGAAAFLDILPTTLEARMKKLGIKKEFTH